MNTIAKVLVSATLALGALSAQAAGVDSYPGDFAKGSAARAVVSSQPSPYIFQGEFLVDNPAYKPAVRMVERQMAPMQKARVINELTVGA